MPGEIGLRFTERVGQLTGARDPQGWPLLTNTFGWNVWGVDEGANVLHNGRTYVFFGDTAILRHDGRPRENTDLIAWIDDPVVLRNGGHRAPDQSWEFFLPNNEQGGNEQIGQPDWRFCAKCNSLFWARGGDTSGSRCRYDGGEHAPAGMTFFLPNDHQGARPSTGQLGWRFCGQCHGLCWAPDQPEHPVGVCPAGNQHLPIGWIFCLPNDRQGAGPQTGQGAWRFCDGCQALFFDGYPSKGVCPGARGGGLRLNPVLQSSDQYFPMTATDPVGQTTDLETPGGAFSHNKQVYVFVNISDQRYSKQRRTGDPALGTYLVSSAEPDRARPYATEFLFSPRMGACRRRDTGLVQSHDPRGFGFVLPHNPAIGAHQSGWRACKRCASLYFAGGGDPGRCFGTGGPHEPDDIYRIEFTLPLGLAEDWQNQTNWRRCAACQSLYFDGYSDKGRCPATSDAHVLTEPVLTLPHGTFAEDATSQRRWRYCAKCAGMFWEGDFRGANGVCPAGDPQQPAHDPWGHDFFLEHDLSDLGQRQDGWRFCTNCRGLFWLPQGGPCPAGGVHAAGDGTDHRGLNLMLTHDVPADPWHQANWRFCGHCSGLFWGGAAGVCPFGGPHVAGAGPNATGFNFVIAHNPGEDGANQEHWRFCQQCAALHFDGQPDRFGGASPWRINDNEHSYLAPTPSGTSLVVLGFGYDNEIGFRLARIPLPDNAAPRLQDTVYYAGSGAWSADVNSAVNLFAHQEKAYTSISLTWLSGPGLWMMLYSHAVDDPPVNEPQDLIRDRRELPIGARFATRPWDLGTAQEIPIFDPRPMGAYGTFMHQLGDDIAENVPPAGDKLKAWAYGCFPLERYLHWDEPTRTLDLYYLLSLHTPYQIQLMHSQLVIPAT